MGKIKYTDIASFKKLLKELHPELSNKLEVLEYRSCQKVLVKTKYAIHLISGSGLLKYGFYPSIKTAVDKTEYWVNFAKERQEGKFNYSKTVYKDSSTPVTITCPIHGGFSMTPQAHTRANSSGCTECGKLAIGKYRKLKKADFCQRARDLHKGFYKYTKVVIGKDKYDKITITCPIHGDFEQAPTNHLSGSGCPACGEIRKKFYLGGSIEEAKDIPHNIYVLEISDGDTKFWKVGIAKVPDYRGRTIAKNLNCEVIVIYQKEMSLFDSVGLEYLIHKKYKKLKYTPRIKFSGYTECFSVNPLEHFEELINKNRINDK